MLIEAKNVHRITLSTLYEKIMVIGSRVLDKHNRNLGNFPSLAVDSSDFEQN
jgi:hypothetical protein